MSAIVPVNVAALRVSGADATNVVGGFAGTTVAFDNVPYEGGPNKGASTGDTIGLPLQAGNSPLHPLEPGVHVHWELPEFFKRGVQNPDTGAIKFPAAPTRWLVVRSLSIWDAKAKAYGDVQDRSWVVESDYLSTELQRDGDGVLRPAGAVPVTAPDGTPFMFMGRVVDGDAWDPSSEPPTDYLPGYTAGLGAEVKLTSIGFVGAAYSSYYPDCRSVFGLWDTFADVDQIYQAIGASTPIKFRASYRVAGWLPDAADDPLAVLNASGKVAELYGDYVTHCAKEKVPVAETPADVFLRLASQRFGWEFDAGAVSFTVDPETKVLTSLTTPDETICAGSLADVVWDALDPPSQTPFLRAKDGTPIWKDDVDIAIGNTTVEAISALVKSHLGPAPGKGVLADYEVLLNSLQLGLLHDLESDGNALATLEQALHTRAFSHVDGGHTWTVQAASTSGADTASPELTLPLALAEQLSALNLAQGAYDRARERLVVLRQQLFMDWVVYIKELFQQGEHKIDVDELSAFLATSGGGELNAVIDAGTAAGLLHYISDDSSSITGVTTDSDAGSLAAKVVATHKVVAAALKAADTDWQLDAVPAAPFSIPTDPVLVMEGKALDPVRRNGPTTTTPVRTDAELIGTLELAAPAGNWTVSASSLIGLPVAPAAIPAAASCTAFLAESALLDPQYAPTIAAATGDAGATALVPAIAACQGDAGPLDGGPGQGSGLFAAVRVDGFSRKANPVATGGTPQLSITFTNPAATAFPPDLVGWTAQLSLPTLAPTRVDPFLPVWLVWNAELDPLKTTGDVYPPGTLEHPFNPVDLSYPLPASFTTGGMITSSGAVPLSKKPMISLTQQIDRYLADFPADKDADAELRSARDDLAGRKVLSQALGGFNLSQTLRAAIPQLPVENLMQPVDGLTTAIADAATTAVPGDSWYDTGLSSLAPLSAGVASGYAFGPLRAGFMEIESLGIIDVFGQRMTLRTRAVTRSGALRVTAAHDLAPEPGDTVNDQRAYLRPRVLTPSRVDAFWLSASHNDDLEADFVETNAHPATSPVCGWVVPNHLERSLVFYDADGSPIGSFGLEHGEGVYRTRAGNLANPSGQDLAFDIGTFEKPRVNPHVGTLMRFVDSLTVDADAGFLTDLMAAIARSDQFINPAAAAQDASLAVFMGRPLAIVRSVLSVSSAGGVLPVSQDANALLQAVTDKWTTYRERQDHTSCGLAELSIPFQLGDLTHTGDGLVAFLPESGDARHPYSTVYSPSASDRGAHHVTLPGPTTVSVKVNAKDPLTMTALVDPRGAVHVATPILPTVTLSVPQDQYVRAMQQLALTFTTRPVLRDQRDLRLPLPTEPGYGWAWIAPGAEPADLTATPAPDVPIYGHGPQRLLEGWLDLAPVPDTSEGDGA